MSNPEIGKSVQLGPVATNHHEIGQGAPLLMIHGSGPGVSAWANWRRLLQWPAGPESDPASRPFSGHNLKEAFVERPVVVENRSAHFIPSPSQRIPIGIGLIAAAEVFEPVA
jgi:hypothetical protein